MTTRREAAIAEARRVLDAKARARREQRVDAADSQRSARARAEVERLRADRTGPGCER